LYVASITKHHAHLQKLKSFNRIELILRTNRRPR